MLVLAVRYFNLHDDLIFQLSYSITGIIGGPLLGIFFLGIMIPRANYKVSQNFFSV